MGLPINGNVNLEYYRRDLYDEMDLKGPPETWDDVIAAARKARKKYGGDVYGYLVRGERGANAASYDYMPLLSGFGGSIFADPPGDWSVVIDSEEALEATDKWLELATYGPPQPGVVTQGTMIGLMQSGQALHTHMTSAAALPLSDPTQTAVADKIDATVIPKPRNGEHATIAGGWLAVTRRTSRTRANGWRTSSWTGWCGGTPRCATPRPRGSSPTPASTSPTS
jgi:multiple sugar transport system substrate-binding protein